MSIRFRHMRGDGPFGIHYTFSKAGEGIPRHAHDSTTEHSIHVLKGGVKVYGPEVRAIVYEGSTLIFDSRFPHEIQALADGTQIFNKFANGMPEAYSDLPPSETDGETALELTHEDIFN